MFKHKNWKRKYNKFSGYTYFIMYLYIGERARFRGKSEWLEIESVKI